MTQPAFTTAIALAALALAPLPTAASTQPLPTAAASTTPGVLMGANGQPIGKVALTPAPTGVLLRVEASGLTPGWHGMHLHAVADCSGAGFKLAGAHINHPGQPAPHGLLNPKGPDAGDLPNIHVGTDGTAQAEFFTTLVRMGGSTDSRPDLLDGDGSALIIHANPDDHLSQPIGGAGDRVACALIKAP